MSNSEAVQNENVLLQRPLNIKEFERRIEAVPGVGKVRTNVQAAVRPSASGRISPGGLQKDTDEAFRGTKVRDATKLPTLVNEVNVNKKGGIDWHEFKLFMYDWENSWWMPTTMGSSPS
ncbi:hypothetical protein niasHT_004822 [Heterodera trifolii]|uniref:Uncharacterized protein n=1 Tax=Heterodera trifolii TaxID=157864 RepID=A0ABD2M9P5_9BILA